MGRRGDLLTLVDRSPGPLRTLEGAVTTWVRRDVLAAVAGSLPDAGAREGPGRDVPDGAGPGRGSLSGAGNGMAEAASTAYVVIDLPKRWRVVERGHITVSDGARSWAGTGSLVTERSAERVAIEDAGVIGICLFPGRLLGALTFGDPVPGELAGRACWVVEARPRPATHGGTAGPPGNLAVGTPLLELVGVDHRFWIDAVTGIVLRHEGEVEGQRCSTVELTDLRFDRPVPPEEFAPPPDAIVRSRYELLRDHLTSVGVDPDDVDLDDPGEVRDALRSGLALDAPRARQSRRDNHVPVSPGPPDPASARAAIRAAIEGLTEADDQGGLPNVQAGQGLAPVYEAARAKVPGQPARISLVVDDCLFLSDDRAVVWYSVLLDGRRPPVVRAREGYAVRVADRWLMERASFADLVGLAGVQCPPPLEP
jgi:hypothetical protein